MLFAGGARQFVRRFAEAHEAFEALAADLAPKFIERHCSTITPCPPVPDVAYRADPRRTPTLVAVRRGYPHSGTPRYDSRGELLGRTFQRRNGALEQSLRLGGDGAEFVLVHYAKHRLRVDH